KIGIIVLRVGMALVFYWFGFKQVLDPSMFSFYVPSSVAGLFGSAEIASFYNGILEIILATFLLVGLFTKWSALILAIHLAGITIIIGLNPTGVRDFGLTIAMFAIVFLGSGSYSIDNLLKAKLSPKWRKRLLI
ncbi:MAG: DoxX family protein, partial [Candidatus Woesearchaeota archaeon]